MQDVVDREIAVKAATVGQLVRSTSLKARQVMAKEKSIKRTIKQAVGTIKQAVPSAPAPALASASSTSSYSPSSQLIAVSKRTYRLVVGSHLGVGRWVIFAGPKFECMFLVNSQRYVSPIFSFHFLRCRHRFPTNFYFCNDIFVPCILVYSICFIYYLLCISFIAIPTSQYTKTQGVVSVNMFLSFIMHTHTNLIFVLLCYIFTEWKTKQIT